MVVVYNLPQRQRQVFEFILENIEKRRESPTLQEIADACAMPLSQAQKIVDALVEKGKITKNTHKFRSITLVEEKHQWK